MSSFSIIFNQLRGYIKMILLAYIYYFFCGEGLSSILRQDETMEAIKGIKVGQASLGVSHLFIADYSLFFVMLMWHSAWN